FSGPSTTSRRSVRTGRARSACRIVRSTGPHDSRGLRALRRARIFQDVVETALSVGTVAALAPGARVTEAIHLVKKLGEGGMGTIWLAHHASLRADVVVKFLAADLAHDPTALARFSDEATAIAQVRSPHIVQVLDHGRLAGGAPFIVMELLE